jgi:V8-like Glu-specific endopeptidase
VSSPRRVPGLMVSAILSLAALQQASAEDPASAVLNVCQGVVAGAAPAHLAFEALSSSAPSGTVVPKIGNGRTQDPKLWPASVWASTTEPPKLSSLACSGTLVGHQVLLTAAHCIADQGTITLYQGSKKVASGVCSHSDGWRSKGVRGGEDWALCLMSKMPEPSGGAGGGRGFEVIAKGAQLRAGSFLQLTGFGCNENYKTDGRFIAGEAEVGIPPSSETAFAATPYYEAGSGADRKAAFVCRGDSGGASYMKYPNGVRRIAAVNSVQVVETGTGRYGTCSATIASPQGQAFMESWLKRPENKDAAICGISSNAQRCRQGGSD